MRLKPQAGGGGREICAQRAELIDVLLRHVFGEAKAWSASKTKRRARAHVAGRYGRGELNPFSDVDVMFLHGENSKRVSATSAKWSSKFCIYSGTLVSKSVIPRARLRINRTGEPRHAPRNCHARIALSSSDAHLVRSFRRQFRSSVFDGFEREYLELRMKDQAARHEKYGNSVHMQEPNVKAAAADCAIIKIFFG